MAGKVTVARAAILERIRRANAGRPGRRNAVSHPIPARAKGDPETLRTRFLENLEFAGASHSAVAARTDVAREAAAWLSSAGLPSAVVAATDGALDGCGLEQTEQLSIIRGAPGPSDAVALTGVVSGIAETGTLMVRSGPGMSARSYFLPEAHIAVLNASAICGSYEDAFARLRESCPDLPRTVTLITGPSRSSDSERIVQIGVHGPQALHVILVDER